MRIAVAEIIHESNTFAPNITSLSQFRLLKAQQFEKFYSGAHSHCTGFFDGAAEFGYEAIPLFSAYGGAGGTVAGDAHEWLMTELVNQLKAASPIDGVLLGLHGAFVSQSYDHADEETARRVRAAFPNVPFVCTLDPHSSIRAGLVESVDALIVYKTNPHIDMRERGLQAAEIITRIVRGQVKPTQAYVQVPMMINIVHQHTASPPISDLWAMLSECEKQTGVLAVSMSLCYQYSDVAAMGNAVVVVTDQNLSQAKRIASDLSSRLLALRGRLRVDIPSVAEAVTLAHEVASGNTSAHRHFIRLRGTGPVVIVDIGDNVGGGSAGDSTFLLSELLSQNVAGWQFTIADSAAVQACVKAGVGGVVEIFVGGKRDALHGSPVLVTGFVKALHNGQYEEREPRHGGVRWSDMGLCGLVQIETPTLDSQPNYLVLTSNISYPMSLHHLSALGIDPEYMKILVVKGAIAWKAAYEPIMQGFIVADSPGATQVNPRRWQYKKARPGLFGLEGW